MRFVQSIEFRGSKEEFERLLERYKELMGPATTVRSARLFEDRDDPGRFVELVEFDSFESAMSNSNHPGTQKWAEEAASLLGGATFRNFDVVGDYPME